MALEPRTNGGHSDKNGFFHFGTVMLSGEKWSWRERAGGEIVFSKSGGLEIAFNSLRLDEQEKLNLVNRLLAHYRPHAIPDLNGYYAASAGITQSGKLFVAVNNEDYIRDPFAGRGCGESAMLRKAQEALGTADVDFNEVYLMSGVAEKRPGGKLKDKQEGHVACLCGECRDNMRRHMRAGKFIMMPANDGTAELTVNRDARSTSELKPEEVWEISYEQMYPVPSHQLLGEKSIAAVRDGYHYITDQNIQALPAVTPLADIAVPTQGNISIPVEEFLRLKKAYEHADFSVSALKDHPTLENINRTMLQLMKRAYAEHADKVSDSKNLDISVILLKTNKGEFFPGILVEGALWLPSKPPEMPTALSNAYNQVGIAEVYMMSFNEQRIRGEISAWNGGSKEGHSLKMPSAASLGRLLKNLKAEDNPAIHILPVNSGQLAETELKELQVTLNAKDAFGPGYANPKRTNGLTH